MQHLPPILYVLFLLAGLAIIAFGYRQYLEMRKKVKSAFEADGIVEDLERGASDPNRPDNPPLYYPVIKYRIITGQWIVKKYHLATNPNPYFIGQSVKVFYDPDQPEKYVLDGDNISLNLPYIIITGGIGIFIFGCCYLLFALMH